MRTDHSSSGSSHVGLFVIRLSAALLLACGLFLPRGAARASGATVRYVNPVLGSDASSCTNASAPCKTIQHALDAADAGGNTIQLAAGTYPEHIEVTKDVTITYPIPDECAVGDTCTATLDGGGAGRVVLVQTGTNVLIENVSIKNGHIDIDGAGVDRGGAGILNYGTLVLNNVYLTNNRIHSVSGTYTSADLGAAVGSWHDLTIMNSMITNNQSDGHGGGVSSYYGVLSITNTQITNNTSAEAGGGLLVVMSDATIDRVTISGNTAGNRGGGVFANVDAPYKFVMTDSTISGNQATNADHSLGFGGGVYFYLQFALINVTISGNLAGQDSGGFYLNQDASGVFDHVTIVGNDSYQNDTSTGRTTTGGAFDNTARLTVKNSILVGKASNGPACSFPPGSVITSQGHNLISDATCLGSDGNIQTSDPLLGDLANNGGPTLTHALLPGSPAIDAGVIVDPENDPVADQRGLWRQGIPDIGAFERLAPVSIIAAVFQPAVAYVGQTVDLAITLTNPNTGSASVTISFTVNLPPGLTVAGSPAGLEELCGGALDVSEDRMTFTYYNSLATASPPPYKCAIYVPIKTERVDHYEVTIPYILELETEQGSGATASLDVGNSSIFVPLIRR